MCEWGQEAEAGILRSLLIIRQL